MARKKLPWWKPTAKTWIHLAYSLPLIALVVRGLTDDLGVNPIETVIRYLGDWALRFLLVALAVTPLRRLTGRAEIVRYRRMLGLWAFAYVVLHLSCFIGLDQFFDWASIGKQIVKNKFIAVGMAAFAMLLPLAVTSTNGMIRWVGAARWKRLHRLVYFAGICGCVHYIWMVKADLRQPMVYAGILAILLGLRIVWALQARRAMLAQPVRSAG